MPLGSERSEHTRLAGDVDGLTPSVYDITDELSTNLQGLHAHFHFVIHITDLRKSDGLVLEFLSGALDEFREVRHLSLVSFLRGKF